MNISKSDQRVLHALAQGGEIRHVRRGPHIVSADCFTRDGHRLLGLDLSGFNRLKRRGLIRSEGGRPYRITRKGLGAVRAQLDNR